LEIIAYTFLCILERLQQNIPLSVAHITMSQDQISTIFTALGKADWMSRIAIGLSGAELDTTLRANG
jgi:hypothetical protein